MAEPEQDTLPATRGLASVEHVLDPVTSLSYDERYEGDALLGKGGMGNVTLAADEQIGRHIAMKILHAKYRENESATTRFVREARVQGQLEHPAIVPVYDLGVNPEGHPYFTMKRVRGVTLQDVLKRLREDDPAVLARYTRRRLLAAFSQVCVAVDFAHQRGVVHRDIKPANVMLGDYGEVYLLDWGIARVRQSEDLVDEGLTPDPTDTPAGATLPGVTLGTPGYMSPEQAHGDHERVGPAADVYALGAILFELLTFAPLHPRGSMQAVMLSTVHGVESRPSIRAPQYEVPPELDDLVVDATALRVSDRLPSARGMHEAIERYLDGERDEDARRTLSQREAALAERAAARATSREGTLEDRREAMRAIGRALALDPENSDALRSMVDIC